MATRGRGSRPPKRVINPVLYIPEGLEDLEYESIEIDDTFDDEEESGGPAANDSGNKKGDGEKGGGEGKPGTPKILKVQKQTLRTRQDGSQVVDIVVVISEKNRADGYKFRVTKTNSGKSNVYEIDEDGRVVRKIPN